MSPFSAEDYANLCALTYFDIPDYRKGMLFSTYFEQCAIQKIEDIDFYKELQAFMVQENYYGFMDLTITDYVNENNQSGLVYYQMEDKENCYLVFRGSELFDAYHNRCGWEDWQDNLEIFLGITHQQLRAYKYFSELKTNKRLHLIGHSKGGNLALFLGCTASEEKLEQIDEIITFNAPGINQDMMKNYEKRIQSLQFQNKVTCYENELDVVSSMFYHVTNPILLKSKVNGLSVNEAYISHQIYSFLKEDNHFVIGSKKTILPMMCDIACNHLMEKMDVETKTKLVHKFMDYCKSSCSLEEMYHVVLYNIGLHRNLLSEDEDFKNVEVLTLLDKFQDDCDSLKCQKVI